MLRTLFNILTAIVFTLLSLSICYGQVKTSETLLAEAKEAAYGSKDYAKAKMLILEGLKLNPEDHEIRVLLGRIYSWTEQADSSRMHFRYVLQKHPDHLEASLGYANLEFWNKNSGEALSITRKALQTHDRSEELLLLHSKILRSLKNYKEANLAIQNTLKINSKNTEARAASADMHQSSERNSLTVNYNFTGFTQKINSPWHLAGLEYSRNTGIGPVLGRMTYGNRFDLEGLQFEAEAYPKLSKTVYAYVNGGFSSKDGIFPRFKGALSVFTSLPAHFEGELGLRYLKFTGSNEIYTAALSKYYRNYWFNFRTYLSPKSGGLSQSYFLTSRYYFGGTDDYFTLGIGTGISPDDIDRNILFDSGGTDNKNFNLNASYKKALKTHNILSIYSGWNSQQLGAGGYSNQYELGLGFQRRF